jgi:hypothetical protein
MEAQNSLQIAQTDINKMEAQSSRFWVSGWRPFIGWIGGGVIAYTYVLRPLIVAIFKTEVPEVNMNELWPVILGILGLGGMRSYEKVKGVA